MLDRPSDNPEPEPKGRAYAFPTKSRCPVCGSLRTYAYSTPGRVQRRKCRDCGGTYKVMGREA